MGTWSGVADAYRESFATLCAGAIERLLADTSGERHLDVGSGTGALAARADALGRKVIAIDADPEMVAVSTAVAGGRVVEGSLPDLPFDDNAFDAVTANFVINHVPDPRAGMRELARVVRPGGRVAATIWPSQPAEWAVLVAGAFSAAGVIPIPGQRLSADLDFERSVAGLRGLAEAAGLEAITATELKWDWDISVDALWGGIAGGVATVGQTFLAQMPEVQASAEREFREAATALAPEGILRLSTTAVYVVAT
ncbi:class I SAM-dependent methyltransferase [Nostocoides sp. HKS02]|uniref:class I SAM-dependent methyltransferase n=1 Tax=Nostocoides sp. HKS02 TaxID=1813880 RepID=UPI0018A82609|nr:class I SAM-dependent methyltransferase [Tetrasphaera sp. HKS02]